MRNYEVALIAHPDVNEEALAALVERVKEWIAAAGGVAGEVSLWGRRRLAYAIRRQTEGQYIFVPAQLPAAAAREIERNLRLNESILRFMITAVEQN